MGFVTNYCLHPGLQALLASQVGGRLLPPLGQWRFWVILTELLDLMSRHMLSYMPKFTRILFHLVVLCDSLRCGAYGTFCYGIS